MGTSFYMRSKRQVSWDHPHACGDKIIPKLAPVLHMGSSPRVWGQAVSTYTTEGDSRIIPTRVGTSSALQEWQSAQKDHPHACGDKQCLCIVKNQRQGSSPRVWGQVILNFGKIHYHGIIPTRVGTRYRFLPPHECN